MIEKHPLYLVVGFFLISLPVLVFHITLFGRSKKFNHILCSLIVGMYISVTVDILLGVFHFFYRELVIALPVTLSFVTAYSFKKKNLRVPASRTISLDSVVVSLAYCVLLVFYVYVTCFSKLPPDTMGNYLLWGRIIAEENYIPAEYLYNNPHYLIGLPPLIYVHIASLFSVTPDYIDIGYSISLFYAFFTIFLVMNWSPKKLAPLLSALLLGSNLLFFESFTGILQEGPLLFYTTVSFFCLLKYIKERSTFYIMILAASCALAAVTKHSGMLLSLLFYVSLVIIDRKKFFRITALFAVMHIPLAVWLIRNYIFIENPFYPFFHHFFKGKYYELLPKEGFNVARLNIEIYSAKSLKRYLISFLWSFPLLILAFHNVITNYKDAGRKIVLYIFVILCIITVPLSRPNMRYIFPFFGVLSYYAGLTLLRIVEWNWLSRLHVVETLSRIITEINNHRYVVVAVLFCFGAVSVITPCCTEGGEWAILDYLKKHEESDEFIIFGTGSKVLWWYGGYTVLEPRSYAFRILNNKRIELDQPSEYYYDLFCRLNITYVYDNPHNFMNEVTYGELKEIVSLIEKDEHFQLVCESDGIRLWKVKE